MTLPGGRGLLDSLREGPGLMCFQIPKDFFFLNNRVPAFFVVLVAIYKERTFTLEGILEINLV